MAGFELRFNEHNWREIEKHVVEFHLRPLADKIAEKCNDESAGAEHPGHYRGEPTTENEKRGYRAGTEGAAAKRLREGHYRATVVTATFPAMADNARHNRLINSLHLAEEDPMTWRETAG